jgi:hypothetical protein
MKLNEYFSGSSSEEKVCKNCFHLMRPIREDLKDEDYPCQNPKFGKMVKLSESCPDYKPFSHNPADLL